MRTSGRRPPPTPPAAMPLWKSAAAHAYYHLTWPYRRWWNRQAAARGQAPAMVLYYHRIADDRASPWTLATRRFIRQIDWLARNFEIVPLAEARRRIVVGRNPRPCVSVTFDDGYSENCHEAIPRLIRAGIPCTYFVTLRHLLTGEAFSHDRAMGNAFPPNTVDQVRAMAAAGIDIGGHTETHANLAEVTDPELLRREIVLSRDELERLVRRPVRHFAFPFGQREHLSRQAMAIAREAGYDAVCSAYGGYNFPGGDGFHLQRIPADEHMIRLKNWVTVDPRKLGILPDEFLVAPEDSEDPVGASALAQCGPDG